MKSSTKRVGLVQSRYHHHVTCFRHDIAQKLFIWR